MTQPISPEGALKGQWRKGKRVWHPQYGHGTVTEDGIGDSGVVYCQFSGGWQCGIIPLDLTEQGEASRT